MGQLKGETSYSLPTALSILMLLPSLLIIAILQQQIGDQMMLLFLTL